jgi:hypothetical protein
VGVNWTSAGNMYSISPHKYEGIVFHMKSIKGLTISSLDIQTMGLEIKLGSCLILYVHDYHTTLINNIYNVILKVHITFIQIGCCYESVNFVV